MVLCALVPPRGPPAAEELAHRRLFAAQFLLIVAAGRSNDPAIRRALQPVPIGPAATDKPRVPSKRFAPPLPLIPFTH